MHTALRARLMATVDIVAGFGRAATSSAAVLHGTCAVVCLSANAG
jgi:hypothetical protein